MLKTMQTRKQAVLSQSNFGVHCARFILNLMKSQVSNVTPMNQLNQTSCIDLRAHD